MSPAVASPVTCPYFEKIHLRKHEFTQDIKRHLFTYYFLGENSLLPFLPKGLYCSLPQFCLFLNTLLTILIYSTKPCTLYFLLFSKQDIKRTPGVVFEMLRFAVIKTGQNPTPWSHIMDATQNFFKGLPKITQNFTNERI